MTFKVTRKTRLVATIAISLVFFLLEILVGFYTHSLALVADAFHYLSDLIGFVVALTAEILSGREEAPPEEFTYGWQRATLLGAFFNGVFLLALGVSIFVQAIERFIHIHEIEKPKLVLIMGCIGLGLNVLVMSFLHEHDHGHGHGHNHEAVEAEAANSSETEVEMEHREMPEANKHHGHRHAAVRPAKHGHDLAMLGVLVHVMGDAINNIGVILSALVIWKAPGEARFYADPITGVLIAVMIFLTAIPLTKNSGRILLQMAPAGINLDDVKHDIEQIPGIRSLHELHVWKLNQHKSIASAHVLVADESIARFLDTAKVVMECLHAYGIHSATLQPEMAPLGASGAAEDRDKDKDKGGQGDGEGGWASGTSLGRGARTATATAVERRGTRAGVCHVDCGSGCGGMRCCVPA